MISILNFIPNESTWKMGLTGTVSNPIHYCHIYRLKWISKILHKRFFPTVIIFTRGWTVPYQLLSYELFELSFDRNWSVRPVLLRGTDLFDQLFWWELICSTSSFDGNWSVRPALLRGTDLFNQRFWEELSCLTSSFDGNWAVQTSPQRTKEPLRILWKFDEIMH